jgi:hypothetical protein
VDVCIYIYSASIDLLRDRLVYDVVVAVLSPRSSSVAIATPLEGSGREQKVKPRAITKCF